MNRRMYGRVFWTLLVLMIGIRQGRWEWLQIIGFAVLSVAAWRLGSANAKFRRAAWTTMTLCLMLMAAPFVPDAVYTHPAWTYSRVALQALMGWFLFSAVAHDYSMGGYQRLGDRIQWRKTAYVLILLATIVFARFAPMEIRAHPFVKYAPALLMLTGYLLLVGTVFAAWMRLLRGHGARTARDLE